MLVKPRLCGLYGVDSAATCLSNTRFQERFDIPARALAIKAEYHVGDEDKFLYSRVYRMLAGVQVCIRRQARQGRVASEVDPGNSQISLSDAPYHFDGRCACRLPCLADISLRLCNSSSTRASPGCPLLAAAEMACFDATRVVFRTWRP